MRLTFYIAKITRYEWLAQQLGMDRERTHMARMSAALCALALQHLQAQLAEK